MTREVKEWLRDYVVMLELERSRELNNDAMATEYFEQMGHKIDKIQTYLDNH